MKQMILDRIGRRIDNKREITLTEILRKIEYASFSILNKNMNDIIACDFIDVISESYAYIVFFDNLVEYKNTIELYNEWTVKYNYFGKADISDEELLKIS